MSALKTTLFASSFMGLALAALNPSCAPGGNFDLSKWTLQLPIGSTNDPDQISSSKLEGCGGYQDPDHQYFFTESGDGALVMKVPGGPSNTDCVTTEHSSHCRTELRESSPSSWSPYNTNTLTVTLAVEQPDNSGKGTVIGQVHIDDSVSTKPVCELYYDTDGTVQMGVEHYRNGTDGQFFTTIGTVPVGQKFSYTINYSQNVLQASINGGTPKTLSTFELDAPSSYFKVGNYNQGTSPSDVHFFAISVSH
ncbi:family 7 polysaccharide lyase [Trichoderma chlorosporum]